MSGPSINDICADDEETAYFIGIPQAQLFQNGQNPRGYFDGVRK